MSAVTRFGEREFDNVSVLTEFLDMSPHEEQYAAADFLETMDGNRIFRSVTHTEAHAHGWRYNLRGLLITASSKSVSRIEAVTGELPSSQLALPAPRLYY